MLLCSFLILFFPFHYNVLKNTINIKVVSIDAKVTHKSNDSRALAWSFCSPRDRARCLQVPTHLIRMRGSGLALGLLLAALANGHLSGPKPSACWPRRFLSISCCTPVQRGTNTKSDMVKGPFLMGSTTAKWPFVESQKPLLQFPPRGTRSIF